MLERPQKIFLESKVGKLPLFQELHGQLPERIHGKYRHIFVGVTANLHKGSSYLIVAIQE